MTVTTADVAIELGRPAPDAGSVEDQQWTRWIARALMKIAARLGDVTVLDQTVLDDVVVMAVADHIRRPDDAAQVDVQVDDGRVSRRYTSSAGEITIKDEWWGLLDPNWASYVGAFSVQPYAEPDLPAPVVWPAYLDNYGVWPA